MFVVPEAPADRDEDVVWPALSDLRRAVTRANIRLPAGPIVVMGHSGAFRTIREWVDHKLVTQVILLDAMYGGQEEMDDFIASGKRAKQHKLIVVGSDTAEESAAFADEYPFAVTRDDMPDSATDFTSKEKKARLLYIRAQYGHMQIVTNGKCIPVLLRLTPLVQV
jgi:predicted SpoU family rRNA methylase